MNELAEALHQLRCALYGLGKAHDSMLNVQKDAPRGELNKEAVAVKNSLWCMMRKAEQNDARIVKLMELMKENENDADNEKDE